MKIFILYLNLIRIAMIPEREPKKLVKIDKWFPSSKTCSVCGKKKDELALSERVYICECGNIMDRDQNAAINIRQEGLKILGVA